MVALGAARLRFVLDVSMQANFTGSVDMTKFLGQMEIYISCLCLSIPALRPFYRWWGARKSSSRADGVGQDDDEEHLYGSAGRPRPAGFRKQTRERDEDNVKMNQYSETESAYDAKVGGSHGSQTNLTEDSSDRQIRGTMR